ncbi:DUF6049 family protein [Microbacterium sp. SORGH_AS_0888]|uniref:DUF6049 family protein n=1 Tax=Microbacterium sp. SORGH_AS_0888 TaxID=3041791 RepID=UPI002784613E|nr:DUF6049 family protein [Microbacterium sp. SORGH_AS_0888]MDQ1130027.1 hypothetical protein [Microbacterium sp. SORGH_AS_0888]
MSPTSAHAGTIATRLRRGALAIVATVALLAGPAMATAAIAAATPSPSATPSGEVTATLSPVGNGVVPAGASLTATLTVTNGTGGGIGGGTASLSLGTAPLADRAALQDWLGGGTAPASAPVATAELAPAAAGATSSASFVVAGDDASLAGRAAGVYALSATAGGLSARSVVVVPAGTPAAVGVIVPITADALTTGLLPASRLAELTAADGELTAQLDAVSGTPAILAIDPAIPAAIRALGSTAPPSASAWLARLESLPNSRFALQFGDADVSAQLAAGLPTPLQPTALTSALDPANFRAEPTPAPSATPTTPTAAVPDLATLLDIGTAVPNVYWPVTGSSSAAAVDTLSRAAPGALTLVPSAGTAAGGGESTVIARGVTAAGADVLVYDSAISAALRDAAEATDAATRGNALATAAGTLALATASAAGNPLLVVVDRPSAPTRAGLRAAITDVLATAGVTPIDLAALAAAPAQTLTPTDGTVAADRIDAVHALQAASDQIGAFATVLEDPSLLTGAERATALQLLGSAWLSQPDAWRQALSDHAQKTAQTLASVAIVQPTSVNLLSADATLPVWIHNELPYPVNVVLVSAPDSLRLAVERETPITASAATSAGASNTSAKVPVRARIANGEVRIGLSLRSPAGVPIGTAQHMDVNVRADWEKYGLVLLAVLVAGFLTAGVVRTVRRRRRAAADRPIDGEDTP